MRKPSALWAIGALVVGLVSAVSTASPATATPSTARPATRPGRTTAGTYHNPLDLQLDNGQRAQSCADPFVFKGRGGDRNWYLYCTTDPLTTTAMQAPVFHKIPTYTSKNLVTWHYVGDAFTTNPSWVKADVGLWAPDVVYRNGHYLLYYTAPDTPGSNPDGGGGGSAIGVATSDSPIGPWTDSGAPVVPPEAPPGGDPAAHRWVFDPEVITANGVSYIYYGSYFGGISARRLSANGLTSDAASETRIAIDNRYEGTFIVYHDGYYYFMGSATNCCNGPLTGYAVFAARSRSPLGPFVDREGRSILASRVGGTPMLTQNGNRWVGPGHNAVVTDYSGQDWIVYHAVDRTDPYFAGNVGFTKRPALIDPLDWRGGWPTVRNGRGPSDQTMPAPAAQPGERTAYHARGPRPFDHPTRPIRALSDSFNGSTLSSQWSWIRPQNATYSLRGGRLVWQIQQADLQPAVPGAPADPPAPPLASVLTERAPRGNYVVETKVATTVPAEGCCFNYMQGGLIIYGDDFNYIRHVSVSIWNTRQSEFGKHVLPAPGYPAYGNTVGGPVGAQTYLRIVVRRGAVEDRFTAYTSLDGQRWERGGTWTATAGSLNRIGLVSMGSQDPNTAGYVSRFDYVSVRALAR